ncbi:intracellular growth attenuator family protein [Yersinia pestis]|nr:intracellular growth attenuator family protein [Yersinia pestis]
MFLIFVFSLLSPNHCLVGCWVLGVGCWVLGVGCWVLGVGCWV